MSSGSLMSSSAGFSSGGTIATTTPSTVAGRSCGMGCALRTSSCSGVKKAAVTTGTAAPEPSSSVFSWLYVSCRRSIDGATGIVSTIDRTVPSGGPSIARTVPSASFLSLRDISSTGIGSATAITVSSCGVSSLSSAISCSGVVRDVR